MYLKTYGFQEKPFHITPNPRFIFLSKNHKESFAHLLYGLQQRVGFLSLTGEVGTGKTTVLRTLLEQLDESLYRVALIFNPCLTALELLHSIHREYAIPCDPAQTNLVLLHDSLNRFLLAEREAGKTVVLVIDEAQNLDPSVLEQLRLLSNLETETEKLIQIVLVGQPELDEIFQRHDMRQLRQRLAVRYQLHPMDAEDTARYVEHRVQVAGCQRDGLFSAKALQAIFKITGGTPRLINILCDRALLVAYGQDQVSVSKADVDTARRELRQDVAPAKRRIWPYLAISALVTFLFVIGAQQFLSAPQHAVRTDLAEPLPVPFTATPQAASEQPLAPPVPELPPPDPARIAALQQAIGSLPVNDAAQQASRALLERWQKPVPSRLPEIYGTSSFRDALRQLGFTTIDFDGRLPDLIAMNTPAILEIVLPNMAGKRFLALVEGDAEQVRTVPGLTETGWLTRAEMEKIWFGKALLPYFNHANIPLISRPDQGGAAVAALQQLLMKIDPQLMLDTGVYDRASIDAVTRFQQQHDLAPDGRVGAQTLFWLYREAGQVLPRLNAGAGS